MENLRFIAAGPTTISMVPKKTIKVSTHESGKSPTRQKIAVGYDMKTERAGWSQIEICSGDVHEYGAALAWRCLDDLTDVIFPVSQSNSSNTLTVEIPGQFVPTISKEAVHEFCRLYRLLRPHFPSYTAITQFKLENSRLVESLIFYLIDKTEGHEVELEPWQNEVLRIKRQERESQQTI